MSWRYLHSNSMILDGIIINPMSITIDLVHFEAPNRNKIVSSYKAQLVVE